MSTGRGSEAVVFRPIGDRVLLLKMAIARKGVPRIEIAPAYAKEDLIWCRVINVGASAHAILPDISIGMEVAILPESVEVELTANNNFDVLVAKADNVLLHKDYTA